jgi:hypothetical protein
MNKLFEKVLKEQLDGLPLSDTELGIILRALNALENGEFGIDPKIETAFYRLKEKIKSYRSEGSV